MIVATSIPLVAFFVSTQHKEKLMNQQEVVTLMQSATCVQDWYMKAYQVKKACGGYPPYWNATTIPTELAGREPEKVEEYKTVAKVEDRQGSLAMIVFALVALAAAVVIPLFV